MPVGMRSYFRKRPFYEIRIRPPISYHSALKQAQQDQLESYPAVFIESALFSGADVPLALLFQPFDGRLQLLFGFHLHQLAAQPVSPCLNCTSLAPPSTYLRQTLPEHFPPFCHRPLQMGTKAPQKKSPGRIAAAIPVPGLAGTGIGIRPDRGVPWGGALGSDQVNPLLILFKRLLPAAKMAPYRSFGS